MIASRTKGIAKLGIACQCMIVVLVFWVWLLLAHANSGFWNLDVPRYAVYNAVLLIGVVLAYTTASSNAWFTHFSFFVCHRHAFRQTAFSTGLLLLLLVGERDQTISRVFLFTLVPILYGILIVTQRLLPPLLQKLSLGGLRMQRVLLAGSCHNVSTLRGWLASTQRLGYTISGLVCHDRTVV